jgi:hypothetical protein
LQDITEIYPEGGGGGGGGGGHGGGGGGHGGGHGGGGGRGRHLKILVFSLFYVLFILYYGRLNFTLFNTWFQ